MVAMAAGGVMAQPVQWRVEDGGNGHWYEYISTPALWTEAKFIAENNGGHLVTIGSAAEGSFVRTLGSTVCWIGLFQDPRATDYWEPAGGWRWLTGEPLSYTNWRINTNGQPNEPNDLMGQGGENWAILDGNGTTWNDVRNGEPFAYCVEYSADCNNDGIVDKGQILAGDLPDANNNGIPDGPGIVVQPTDQTVGVDAPVTFIVEAAASSCSTPVTYQWQRRNPVVTDPAATNAWIDLADSGGFFGTRGPNLSISRPTPGLATGYRCKIGGGCGCEPGQGGFVYTNTVNFSVACPADFNADGGIDFGDVEAFFERWENGC
jgi:hypothetical protein